MEFTWNDEMNESLARCSDTTRRQSGRPLRWRQSRRLPSRPPCTVGRNLLIMGLIDDSMDGIYYYAFSINQ
jgi:hypothetical protein